MFRVCWCPNERYIKDFDSENNEIKSLKRCCPKTKMAIDNGANLTCVLDKKGKEPEKYCDQGNFGVFSQWSYNTIDDKITWNNGLEEHSISSDGGGMYDICVAPTIGYGSQEPGDNIKMKLFMCKIVPPCNGRHPCLR